MAHASDRKRKQPSAIAWLCSFLAMAPLVGQPAASAAASAELIMFRQDGCAWCAVWQQEIGPIYPKTKEGQFAPLRQVDIRNAAKMTSLKSPVTITPTFVVIENEREIGRIIGYPGASFFWELLSEILARSTFVAERNNTPSHPQSRADARDMHTP